MDQRNIIIDFPQASRRNPPNNQLVTALSAEGCVWVENPAHRHYLGPLKNCLQNLDMWKYLARLVTDYDG